MANATWLNIGGIWKKVTNVWQNVGGVWKQKVVPKGNIGGVWKEFIQYSTKLYELGTEYYSIVQGYCTGTPGKSYTYKENTDNITLTTNPKFHVGYANCSLRTQNVIDLTNVNTIYVDWERTGSVRNNWNTIYVSEYSNSSSSVAATSIGASFTRQVSSLNVSSLSGKYYIVVNNSDEPNSWGDLIVYRLWME